MTSFSRASRVYDVLQNAAARELMARHFPGVFADDVPGEVQILPLAAVVAGHPTWPVDGPQADELWAALAEIEQLPPVRPEPPALLPDPDYEDASVERASARVTVPASVSLWRPLEIRLDGPAHGNPFVDVELTARFRGVGTGAATEVTVGGFYDGDGRWVLRYLPPSPGRWEFTTSSTARSLDGITGTVVVTPAAAGDHGPVRADGFHFAHADGTRHLPLGTTAYAWINQPAEVRKATLATLEAAPFSKLRMTVFPKAYVYNDSADPESFAFARAADGAFDHTRFDPAFFRLLEESIVALGERGIQADVILFHPYDRWGFSRLDPAADERYLRYVVRRLSGFANVWWSMANEYDLMVFKTIADWDRLARVVTEQDPVGHLLGIHNCFTFFDHSADWVTHASVQRVDAYRTTENVEVWRKQWGKAVVVDECGYEGDLEHGWGNLTAEEMVRRCWEAAVRGGYAGHGETYWRADEQIWWAKGGQLTGGSPERIAFLRQVTEHAPGGVLDPVSANADVPAAGLEGRFYLVYFGRNRPRLHTLRVPGGPFRAEVIDTWGMTVEPLAGRYASGDVIDLPAREFIALRLTADLAQ